MISRLESILNCRVIVRDIIFDEGHYWEVNRLAAEFELLAQYGKMIIENFSKMAEKWRESCSIE